MSSERKDAPEPAPQPPAPQPASGGSHRHCERLVRVVMYPYVPRGAELFMTLKKAFEAGRPGVTVQLVDSRPRDPRGTSDPAPQRLLQR